jgi:hypothetical protein
MKILFVGERIGVWHDPLPPDALTPLDKVQITEFDSAQI